MNRSHRIAATLGLLLVVCLSGLTLAQAPPKSLTDYLASRNRPTDAASRAAMWKAFRPDEPYDRSARQNIQLRNWLVAEEYAPTLSLDRASYLPGQDVVVRVAGRHAAKGFESDLRLQSGNVANGQFVAGEAKQGVFGVRVFTDHGHTIAHLVLRQTPTGLEATLAGSGQARMDIDTAAEFANELMSISPARAKQLMTTEQPLVKTFFDGLTKEMIFQSFVKAGRGQLADPANQVALVRGGMMCTIAAGAAANPATVPVAGVAWKECVSFAGEQLLDLSIAALEQAVDDHPTFNDAQKKTMREYIKLIRVLQLASSISDRNSVKTACELAENLFETMGNVAQTEAITNPTLRMTVSMVADAGAAYTVLVCNVKPVTP